MSVPHKRSVSPFSLREDEKPAKKTGFGFSGIFSFFKQKHEKVSSILGDGNTDNKELQIVQNEPLMNEFTSLKKRRLSLQVHEKNGFVPRSSTLGNSIGRYQSFYDNLKTEKEDRNNDLERRLSTAFDAVNDNPKIWNESTRDDSPLVDLVTQEAMIQRIEEDEDEEEVDSPTSDGFESQNDYPLIIEHEFATLYKDSEGNLVRPPFINLDPRERYHLLQLKKSIEASESLQRRVKYMIDPNETTSRRNSNSNKVETSTQTNNFLALESTTKFASKRKLQDRKYLKNTKRAKNNKGFYVGEFMYELEDEPKEKVSKEYEGYLGDVKKPDFSVKKSTTKFPKSGTQINESQDQSLSYVELNKYAKSTNSRPGLNESLLNNSKLIVSLDDNYVKDTEKVGNIIKLKEDILKKDDEKKSTEVIPSSGFQFSINKENINEIITSRKEKEANFANNNKKKKRGIDDADDYITKAAPKFSFGKPSEIKSLETEDKATNKIPPKSETSSTDSKASGVFQPPKFSFDLSNKTATESKKTVPLFSSNKNETSNKETDKTEESKPSTYTFGGKTDSKHSISFGEENNAISEDKTKPNFSFGKENSTALESTAKPSFSFGKEASTNSESTTKTTFSFGKENNIPSEGTPKPAFSFGGSNDIAKPAFTFGKEFTTNNKSDESSKDGSTPKPLFSSSIDNSILKDGTLESGKSFKDTSSLFKTNTETKDSTPFSFDSSKLPKDENKDSTLAPVSVPSFTFGGSKTSNVSETIKDKTPPAFSFGNTKIPSSTETPKKTTPAPAFSFGDSGKTTASDTQKSTTPATVFSFGNSSSAATLPHTDAQKPAFTFGKAASKEISESPKVPATSTFGAATSSNSSNPAFGFTNKSKEATPTSNATPKPTFNFGTTNQIGSSMPNASGSSTPTSKFNFGQTSTTFGANNTSSNFGTSNSFSGFGSRPGSALNNSRSNETTPQPFNFNAQQSAQSTASMPSMPTIPTMPTVNSAPVFNFTGSASKEGTPDPASIFGGMNNPSRENTPFGAAPMNGAPFGSAPPNPTPMNRGGRKIAHMRQRRR